MRNFTQAAASSMSSTNPGFSGFMNNIMTEENDRGVPDSGVRDLDGINIQETYTNSNEQQVEKSFQRPSTDEINRTKQRNEMSGPSDISEILSNIKKTTQSTGITVDDNESTISISELKEIQGSLSRNSMAKSSKKKSSKNNVIQLDV